MVKFNILFSKLGYLHTEKIYYLYAKISNPKNLNKHYFPEYQHNFRVLKVTSIDKKMSIKLKDFIFTIHFIKER